MSDGTAIMSSIPACARSFWRRGKIQLLQEARKMADGQPDNVWVTTLQALHRLKGSMLNGVSASLIHWVAGGHVGQYFLIVIIAHAHICDTYFGEQGAI